jgi:hypothetical protein
MDLTTDELRDRVADLKRAYLSGVLEVRFSDGKSQRFQNMGDMLKAIQTGEDWIGQAAGQNTNRVSFAQHKRGDGPSGPSRFGCR